jgi:hypothetical protein
MEWIKKYKKIIIIALIMILIAVGAFFGYKKMEQARIADVEMQNRFDLQQAKINEQQAKLEELQGFRSTQEQVNADANAEEWQNKKSDCETRLKKAQDALVSSQRHLGEDQEVLKNAEADKCNDCYTGCLKSYGCIKSGCGNDDDKEGFDKIKKQCKEHHEENLKFRRQDVAGDLESVKNGETKLQAIKDECSQYLNNQ